MILSKKVSWILLTLYFIFDNVVSYWAIKWMGGREANLAIAHWVETYPLLYFLCIPLEILAIYIIVLVLREITAFVTKHWKFYDKAVIEKIILTAIVIFWPIANSSINFGFLIGFHHLGYFWGSFTAVGFFTALIYGLFTLLRQR